MQKIYSAPIKENLIGERIRAIKKAGAVCAATVMPTNTKKYAQLIVEAGADLLFVQSPSLPPVTFPRVMKAWFLQTRKICADSCCCW